MTRHDEMLAETALREVRGLGTAEAVRRLFEMGLISRRECERQAIRDEVRRLEREGCPAAKRWKRRPENTAAPMKRRATHFTPITKTNHELY